MMDEGEPTLGQLKSLIDGAWKRVLEHEADLQFIRGRIRELRTDLEAVRKKNDD